MRKNIFKEATIIAVLILLPFLLPYFHVAVDIGLILSFVSLLFTILIGFFIGTATTNYIRLQSLISNLNADLIKIFFLGKKIQHSAAKNIADKIDQYVIATLDYPFLEWAPNVKKEFDQITQAIEQVKPSNEVGIALLPYLLTTKSDLDKENQEIILTSKRIFSVRHWLIIISLVIVIAILLLSLRDGYWAYSLIIGILLVSLFQILVLAYEVDSNIFLARKLAYKNPQQIFQAIGKMPYYPGIAILDHSAAEPNENYRIGIYKNYPHSLEKKIKIIKKK